MKRFYAVLLACLGLYACKPGIPKTIIQPDKMEKVLFDIHVVDGYISTMSTTADSTKKIASAYYKGVYQKFQIDSALYNQSLNYYYQHPDILKKIYENVSAQLNKVKEKQLKSVRADTVPKPKADSAKLTPKPSADSLKAKKADSVALVPIKKRKFKSLEAPVKAPKPEKAPTPARVPAKASTPKK